MLPYPIAPSPSPTRVAPELTSTRCDPKSSAGAAPGWRRGGLASRRRRGIRPRPRRAIRTPAHGRSPEGERARARERAAPPARTHARRELRVRPRWRVAPRDPRATPVRHTRAAPRIPRLCGLPCARTYPSWIPLPLSSSRERPACRSRSAEATRVPSRVRACARARGEERPRGQLRSSTGVGGSIPPAGSSAGTIAGADREELDRVPAPAVALLLQAHPDDALGLVS